MKTLLIKLLMKFVSVDLISKVIALCIAKLLRNASKRGGKAWETSKAALKKSEIWIHLFNEVYDDDELTKEEEEKIAAAIAELTAVKKITNILNTTAH